MNLITTPAGTYAPGANTVVHATSANLITMERGEPVHLRQYDQTVPVIAVELYVGQQPYSVPDGAAVNIRMEKPDKKHVYNPAKGVSSDRQTAYFEATAQMTAAFGSSEPIVEIVIAGGVAGTAAFSVDIAENPIPEDAYESTDEYKTIQQLAAEVTQAAKIVTDNEAAIQTIGENLDAIKRAPTEAANAAASATLSQSWAVGGTGTREGENTNNAQYYAQLAQQVSQGAVGWYETEQALQAAHPTGQNGQWAIIGTTDTIWAWDSDTSAWVNTGSQIDLSNYYQKQEADARFQMPVGYIFEWAPVSGQSVDLSTPEKMAQYFGYGTWAEYAPGKVLAATNSDHAVGTSVGEESHVMSLTELVPHVHKSTRGGNFIVTGATSGVETTNGLASGGMWQGEGKAQSVGTSSAGDGQPMSLMQPTQYIYRWQRIA